MTSAPRIDTADTVRRANAARPQRRSSRASALLALPGAVALLAGLDAALLLLDLPAPVTAARLRDVHGVLLVLGFVGCVVALERAVALRAAPGFVAPGLLGLGAVALVTPLPGTLGGTALLLGTLALVAVYVPLWRRQRGDVVLVQILGAVLAAGAATLWLGGVPVPHLIPWLAGFVVLTVAAERVELARIAVPASTERGVLLASGAVTVATVAALLWPRVGYPALGLAVLGLTVGSPATTSPAGRYVATGSRGSRRGVCWRPTPGWRSPRSAGWSAGRSSTASGTTRWCTRCSWASRSR